MNGNGNGDGLRAWVQHAVAPAVMVSVIGGAATTGYLFGRNELAQRVAVLEQRQMSHSERSAHPGAVPLQQYNVTVANMAEDIGEIKATLEIMRGEIADLRRGR